MRLFSFRLGLLLGGIIGYILGARAGRQRYEQITAWTRNMARSQPAQQVGAEVRQVAGRAGKVLEDKATEGVTRLTDRLHEDDEGTSGPSGA